ncbi:nitrile hydratase subunit beta [Streptomyces albofaciens JCM 4342]|uniref:SH3-like domain-containing protein n=1 Tax=Streptomyces albofaciens TaxID=66866 RepID=UPI000A52C003|nr:nitrile hydratase subunit beta [Streptomyces albofaciens JCM 4342]
MGERRYSVGEPVRVRPADPPHHTRVPRYVRGHVGHVVVVQPPCPLPDDVARRRDPFRVLPVYTVRFAARDLWGSGAHIVLTDLWECYLEPAGEAARDLRGETS